MVLDAVSVLSRMKKLFISLFFTLLFYAVLFVAGSFLADLPAVGTALGIIVYWPAFVLGKLGLSSCMDASALPQKVNCAVLGTMLSFVIYSLGFFFTIHLFKWRREITGPDEGEELKEQ